MKAAKNLKKKIASKNRCQNQKKQEHAKDRNKNATKQFKQSLVQTNSKASGATEGSTNAIQTSADERRLRKLKVYLKSVSYNGCEGTVLPNLNNLYLDQLIVDEFPCNELPISGEFKCNPTPFLIASCFNRNQAKESSKKTGRKSAAKKTSKKENPTPTKKSQQSAESSRNKPKHETAFKTNETQRSPLRTAEKKPPPARRLFIEQSDKPEKISPGKIRPINETLAKPEEKTPVKEEREKVCSESPRRK